MKSLLRHYSPLVVALVLGMICSIAIALFALRATWLHSDLSSNQHHSSSRSGVILPPWFEAASARTDSGRAPDAVRWIDSPFFHAGVGFRMETDEDGRPVHPDRPNQITDSVIMTGFPWAWLEWHDASIARDFFESDNPWLKPHVDPSRMGVDPGFRSGIRIDPVSFVCDVGFFASIYFGLFAVCAKLRGSTICRLPPRCAASISLGIMLPVLIAWTSGFLLVGPPAQAETWLMSMEEHTLPRPEGGAIIREVIRVPGGSSTVDWFDPGDSTLLPLTASELRLGWPFTIARSTEHALPVTHDTWEEVLFGMRSTGLTDGEHASFWKVVRAPVIWWAWLLDSLFWTMVVGVCITSPVLLRRWWRHQHGRCPACAHLISTHHCCTECGQGTEWASFDAFFGSLPAGHGTDSAP